MIIRPAAVERFHRIEPELGDIWRGISSRPSDRRAGPLHDRDRAFGQVSRSNRTLRIERELGERLSRGLSGPADAAHSEARAELERWIGYCSKLARRRDAGDADVFTVLPTQTRKRASDAPVIAGASGWI
jgi:hypothetical protein